MFSETDSPQSGVSNNASPKIFWNGHSRPLGTLKSKIVYLGHANTDDKHPVLPLCGCHDGCLSLLSRRWFSPDGQTAVSYTQPQQRRATSRTAKIVCACERERMSHSVLNSLSTNHGQVLLHANEAQCPRDSYPQDHHLILNSVKIKK